MFPRQALKSPTHVWASPASSAVPPAARSSTSPAPATRFSALSRSLPPQAHPSRTPPCSRTPPPASSSANSAPPASPGRRSEEHTSELQSRQYLVCRLLLEKKKYNEKKRVDTTN